MQQMFRCHKCGWQNVIGQRFCGSCGEQFQYNCPHCNTIVDTSFNTCPTCGTELSWGFQQQTPPPASQDKRKEEQYQQYQKPQKHPGKKTGYASEEDKLKQKKKSQYIVIFALTGLIICIGIGIYLAVITFSQDSNPPPLPSAHSDNQTTSALTQPQEYIAVLA